MGTYITMNSLYASELCVQSNFLSDYLEGYTYLYCLSEVLTIGSV